MKINIKNKTESKNFIMKKGFNYFPDLFCHKTDLDRIKIFIETNKASLYILRDAKRPHSPFYFFKNFEECLEYLKLYLDEVIIAVSVNAYQDHKVILGTIELTSDNRVFLTASTDPKCDHRSIFEDNDYNINCKIDDKSLDNIPMFDDIYSFLVDHELIDVIVEYTFYDIPVGIKSETLVIQEVRHY